MPRAVCFSSKTSKLDGHLSTLADKLHFILLENTETTAVCGFINYALFFQLKLRELSRTLVFALKF